MVKNLPANAGDTREMWFDPWVRKIPWRKKWQLTPGKCLQNAMARGARWAIVHRVTKSRAQLCAWACTHCYLQIHSAVNLNFPREYTLSKRSCSSPLRTLSLLVQNKWEHRLGTTTHQGAPSWEETECSAQTACYPSSRVPVHLSISLKPRSGYVIPIWFQNSYEFWGKVQ